MPVKRSNNQVSVWILKKTRRGQRAERAELTPRTVRPTSGWPCCESRSSCSSVAADRHVERSTRCSSTLKHRQNGLPYNYRRDTWLKQLSRFITAELLMIKEMFSLLLGDPKYGGELTQRGVDRTSPNMACTQTNHRTVTSWSWISAKPILCISKRVAQSPA